MSEHDLQVELVRRARAAGAFAFSVPNERASKRNFGALRARGLMPGIPDLLVIGPIKGLPVLPGLAIELKTDRGNLRPNQVAALWRFAAHGWAPFVVRGHAGVQWLCNLLGW